MELENRLNAQQSLELISKVIGQTKENIKSHSFIFLLWGWALALASLLRFVLQTQTNFEYYFLPFPILAAFALVITVFNHRKNTSETYLGFFLKKLWTVLAFGFIAIVFVSVYQKMEPFTFTLILASIGTMVSGLVLKFNPLIIGGICFLISSILCVFIADEYKVLIHGVAIILGYLIPGYLLKNSKV